MARPWTTGFVKEPVEGSVWLGRTNLAGDGQADLRHHGGIEKAVLAYAAEHYPYWREVLNIFDLPYGSFGENFTIQGATESTVCIGDIYAVGENVRLQVSQPRQPCWKLARRWQKRDLALQVQREGKTGWYFRVLQEGFVEAPLPLHLCDRPYPEWSITQANHIMHEVSENKEATARLASCHLLSAGWRETLSRRVERGTYDNQAPRLWGDV